MAALSSRHVYPLSSSSSAEIVGRPLPSQLQPRKAFASPALVSRGSSLRAGRCFASLQANAAVAAPAELKQGASRDGNSREASCCRCLSVLLGLQPLQARVLRRSSGA